MASSEPALLSPPPVPVAPVARPRHVPAVWALGLLALANAIVIVALWWRAGGVAELTGTASTLTSLGRLSGLGGAALALVGVLLVARLPVLDRLVGLDRLTRWHRVCGAACLSLLLAHAALITTGYALADRLGIIAELSRMIGAYPGVITAIAGLVLLIGVSVSSVIVVRRRLRYETWYFVHLYAYLAIALAFSHQIATGRDFVGDPLARAYWIGLYVATLVAVLGFRIGQPVVRSWRHRLRVERVVAEGPGVVSLDIGGVGLEQLRARPGQFFSWRFLTRDRWWEAHPFSLSAAPDGRRLRITVKELGDYTAWLRSVRPGTRILAEGPYGAFTSAARRRPRVVLIAGGLGITPVRALLEEMPGGPGDIAVLYRTAHADDILFRAELDELAEQRGADLHYVVGERRQPGTGDPLSAEHLAWLVPDIADRDVYLCGPPGMIAAIRTNLQRAGVPRRRVIVERFAL